MIQGLLYMKSEDLAEVSRLAGLSDDAIAAATTREELIDKILHWMADVVGSSKKDNTEAIERDVIEWTARRWNIEVEANDATSDVEKRLRKAIADESSRHLMPFWEVGCAMAYVGPEDAVAPKLELMETAASRLVPSGAARQRLRTAWEQRRAPDGSWEQVLETLAEDIELVKEDPDMVMSTLVLSLVVAMADGRFGTDEEFFYEALASQLGVTMEDATKLKTRVNNLYWEKQQELLAQRKRGNDEEDAVSEKYRALKAAHLTLETSGILQSLEDEVRSGFLGQLHKTMSEDPDFNQGVKSWRKSSMLWPVGYAAGMCLYFKNRLKKHEHPGLIKAVFLSICRQHLLVRPEAEDLDREAVGVVEVDDRSTDKLLLDSTMAEQKDKAPIQKIQLERD